MSTFGKVLCAWVGLVLLGLGVSALAMRGTSAWLITLAIFVVGLITYYALFEGLGVILMAVAGVAATIQMLGLLWTGVCWVWDWLGWFRYVVVIGAIAVPVLLVAHRRNH